MKIIPNGGSKSEVRIQVKLTFLNQDEFWWYELQWVFGGVRVLGKWWLGLDIEC